MARLFGKHDRAAAELMTGRSGHADHITPYSRGGATDITNLQLIPADVNRKKGAFHYEPRPWQQEFHQRYAEYQSIGGESFLLVATPGSGKTHAALHECQRFCNDYGAHKHRIVIIVPSDNLRTKWIEDAHKHGLSLGNDPTMIKDGYQGIVMTYQGMATSQVYMQKLCDVRKVMLVCDEVHHCGDENSWGAILRASFSAAHMRLMMSGTPARTDGTPIPFIRYDDEGYFLADYTYNVAQATRDGVIRPVAFLHQRGSVSIGNHTVAINKDCTQDDERHLGRLVASSGAFAREMLQHGRQHVDRLRDCGVSDAAALVVVSDQAAAGSISRLIREMTGEHAEVIVSDESISTTTVDRFRNGRQKWLVAVQKVSEGTDIPRLQVLVWLTNKTTELAFRQIVGRVVRMRDGQEIDEATVVLPETPTLLNWALTMKSESEQGLREKQQHEEQREMSERVQVEMLPFTTSYDGSGDAIIDDAPVESSDAQWIAEQAAACNTSIRTVYQIAQAVEARRNGAITMPSREEEPRQVQEKRLRDECGVLVKRLARLTANTDGRSDRIKEIHAEYVKSYGKGQGEMSIDELTRKRDDLQRRIDACGRRA